MNKRTLFNASCIALAVTAMTFAIRAGILTQLGTEFGLTDTQLGHINKMAFWGFPLATIFGGLLYNIIGAKRMMIIAFICHLAGLLLTIFADGYMGLLISTFFIGFANGSVEAGANPMVADLYHDNKSTMLNKFHVWFPGGIVIGALISKFMADAGLGWQLQIAVMIIPTIIYGFIVFTQKFPETQNIETSTEKNIKGMLSPLFIFMMICMALTATTELGTQQWVEKILSGAGAHPLLVLALITGLMAVGRFFAGPIIHKLNPTGVLFGSAIIAAIALYSMSLATGPMVYVAAILFAVGVMYFWPTMIGFVGEYCPKTGPLGMSIVGGAGMLGAGFAQPIIGGMLDAEKAAALATGVSAEQASLIAGQSTLASLVVLPIILIVAFGALYFYMRNKIAVHAA